MRDNKRAQMIPRRRIRVQELRFQLTFRLRITEETLQFPPPHGSGNP
jgi:hypothetical protein